MKRLLPLFLLFPLAACTPSQSAVATAHVDTCEGLPLAATAATGANALPDISIECLEGKERVQLSHVRGPILIPVWASWCGPCREEMPIMQQFSDAYGEKVPVLGYALLDDGVQAIMGSYNWEVTLASVEDPDGAYRADIGVTAPPTTLFVDAGGRIAYRHIGAIKNLQELKHLVQLHLGVAL